MPRPDWSDRPTTAWVGGDWFHVVESPADEWIAAMERQTEFRNAVVAALQALKADLGCIDAHLFVARHARADHGCYGHLVKAVETGKALWQSFARKQGDFAWWGVTATRPYMRAVKALGDWHVERGDHMTARRLYEQLLEMHPADGLGVRNSLEELSSEIGGLRR